MPWGPRSTGHGARNFLLGLEPVAPRTGRAPPEVLQAALGPGEGDRAALLEPGAQPRALLGICKVDVGSVTRFSGRDARGRSHQISLKPDGVTVFRVISVTHQ